MPVTQSSVSTMDVSPQPSASLEAVSPGFEDRWAAWIARGVAHDRAVRRKMVIAAPALAAAAVILYILLVR